MKIPVPKISEAQWRQAIKTGIAGCLAMFVANALKLPQGYWAAISAVIVMQSRLGAALGAGWSRMAGTAIGAAVAVPFTRIWGSNLLAFGVAVIVSVLICSILELEESYRLASTTVAIVMLVSSAAAPWIVAVHRFLEVTLGIAASVLVTQFVWPSRAVEALRYIADALIESEALFRAAMARFRGENSAPLEPMQARIEQILGQNDILQKHASYEWAVARGSAARLLILSERAEVIFRLVESLGVSLPDARNGTSYRPYEPELGQLDRDISTALNELARSIKEDGRPNRGMPDLKTEVARLTDKISVIRKSQSTQGYDLEEVLRLYAVLLGLIRLGEEVDRMHRATRHNLKS